MFSIRTGEKKCKQNAGEYVRHRYMCKVNEYHNIITSNDRIFPPKCGMQQQFCGKIIAIYKCERIIYTVYI